MNFRTHIFDLELKHTFRISREERNTQATLILELVDGELSGFGEATATKFYGVGIDQMLGQLEMIRPFIEKHSYDRPERFWSHLQPKLAEHPFLLCALDNASYDLYGKKWGKPIYKIWNLEKGNIPKTNLTIGIGPIEEMIEKVKEQPWPIYKIKLGTDQDIEIIENLRKHTDAVFRVDANCAWTIEETIEKSVILKKLGVEFIEQPLPDEEIEGMEEVYIKSALPLIADESCREEGDVTKCVGRFHGINIKLTKCGGLTPARRMINKAKQLGLKVMVGCMTESTIGISAIAHLLPMLDYVDMDGPLLLNNDPGTGIEITGGNIRIPDTPGLGCSLK